MADLTLTVTPLTKTMTADGPIAATETVPVAISAAADAADATLSIYEKISDASPLAECTITSGAGSLDLSTNEILALFADKPPTWKTNVVADLWDNASNRLIARGFITLYNRTASSVTSLRIGAQGEISVTLSGTLAAGTPIYRNGSGLAAACTATLSADFLGILRTGGEINDVRRCVTAGAVSVPDWALEPGAWYFLPSSGASLTKNAPTTTVVRPVGIAIDASTLVLIPHANVVQATSTTTHYLTYSHATRRFTAVSPTVTTAGTDSAGLIPCLDADGKLAAGMIPSQQTDIRAALAAEFAALADLDDPSIGELIARVNQISTILKG